MFVNFSIIFYNMVLYLVFSPDRSDVPKRRSLSADNSPAYSDKPTSSRYNFALELFYILLLKQIHRLYHLKIKLFTPGL